MITEAINIYAEGVTCVEDIETARKQGVNHLMVSLVYGDFIRLEVVLRILDVMLKETSDN